MWTYNGAKIDVTEGERADEVLIHVKCGSGASAKRLSFYLDKHDVKSLIAHLQDAIGNAR